MRISALLKKILRVVHHGPALSPRTVRKVWFFTLIVLSLPFILLGISVLTTKYNSLEVKKPYTASALAFRSHKKEFTAKEIPSFKVYVGTIKSSNTSPQGKLKRLFSATPQASADDSLLPTMEINIHRTLRTSDTEKAIFHQSGTDEIEVSVQDIKAFHPGKYKITIKSGTRNIEQDFTWGVLAVNTNKSIYLPGETAKIGMALLDDLGRTKCFNYPDPLIHGEMWLTITDPQGKKTELSTKNGRITGSANCAEHSVTNDADFQATFKTTTPGIYQMHVEGENQNGKRSIDDYFEVKNNQPFIIERTSLPTRIYPASKYTNTITITTTSAFKGEIREKTPASFHITCAGCKVEGADSINDAKEPADKKATHTLVWNVDWQAGETHKLSYTFDPPRISPEFYILGPISITKHAASLFTEARPWQIASDAIITWNGNGGTNNWNLAGNWAGGVACTAAANNCTFDGSNPPNGQKNATINVAISVASVDILTGYTGTITQAGTITTSATVGLSQADGTFTGATQAVTHNTGGFSITGGTFSGTSGVTTVNRDISITGGTYTKNGTITITDGGSKQDTTVTCSQTLGGTVNLSKSYTSVQSGTAFTLSSGCTISGATAVGTTYYTGATNGIVINGDFTLSSGTMRAYRAGVSVGASGSLTVSSGATVQLYKDFTAASGATITNSGTIEITDGGAKYDTTVTCSTTIGGTVNLTKTYTGGSTGTAFTLASGCTISGAAAVSTTYYMGTTYGIVIDGDLTLSSGTMRAYQSGVSVGASGTLAISSGATLMVYKDFTAASGATITNSGTIEITDGGAKYDTTVTCSTTIGGTVNLTKTYTGGQTGTAFTLASGCTISSATAAATNWFTGATNGIVINGDMTLTSGTWHAYITSVSIPNGGKLTINSGATLDVYKDFTSGTTSGNAVANSGTITFTQAYNSTLTCDQTIGGTITLGKTTGVASFTLSAACTVSNAVASGTTNFKGTTYGIVINGDLTLNGATALQSYQSGVSVPSGGTLTVASGASLVSGKDLNVQGTINNNNGGTITMSDTGGLSAATLSCGASTNVGKLTINKASGGSVVLGSDCTVGAFTRTLGVINNPASAYTLKVQGDMLLQSTTNIGGANMTISMEGSTDTTFNFAATSTTFISKFQVNKTGTAKASLITTALVVTGQTCTVAGGTFDINGIAFTCSTGVTVQSGGNFQLRGTETPTTPTLNSGSTVTYTGTGTGNTYTLKAWPYHHLTINGTGNTFQPGAAMTGANDIGGNLTVTAGTFDVTSGSNYAVDVVGNFSNAGTYLAQAGTLKVGTNFANTGTFTKGTGTVEFNTASTTVVSGSGSPVVTFNNLTVTTAGKTVQFTAGITVRVDGLLTITGTAGSEVVINSTTSSQWFINHQGTENVTYANVTNSGCDGTSTSITLDATSINNGNNGTCWDFPILNITVSGNIYTDEGSTAYDCSAGNLTVNVAVNGGANSTGTCTLSTGAFSVTAIKPTAAGQPVVIFIDNANAASAKATTITLTADATSNITGVKVYKDHVLLSHESAGPIANSNLATGDNADAGIRYSVASSNLTVESGMQLMVYNSKTFTPGGTVTTQGTGGDFHLASSATATLGTATNTISNNITIDTSATLNINTDTVVAGGGITATGTLNTTSGTPTITMRGIGSISGAGSKTVYNLLVGDGTPATTTLSGSLTATNDITVGTGSTLNQNASLTINGGDFTTTTSGVVNTTSGTSTVTITGTGNVGAGSGGSFTVYNLAANGTQTLISNITTTNNLSVATGGSLALASKNVTVSGGTMSTAGTGTITCSGCSAGTVTLAGTGTIGGGGTVTVYTLQINGTQTLASALTVSNTANVSTGAILDLGSQNMTVNGGDFTNTTTGIIRCNSCSAGTLTLTATGALGGGNGNITLYNLATSGTGTTTFSGSGTNTVSNNVTVGTGTTLNLNSDTSITGSLTNTTTGIIGTSVGTPTVTVSGSTIGGGSGAITFYNLTKDGAGTTTFSGSGTNTVNNNLSISNGSLTLSNALTVANDGSVSTGATFTINANLAINGGDLTTAGTGVITTSSGTPTVTLSGTGTLGSGNGNITIYNLTTTGTGTTTFSGGGTNSVTNNVSVGAGTTLNINSSVTITGSLTNATSGVIGTTSGTPTVTVQGTSIGGGTTGAITFYNLTKSGAGTTTFSNGGTNTITNNLAITAGTLTQSDPVTVTNDITVSTGATFNTNATLSVSGGDMTTAGTGVINTTSGTPTLTISGTGTIGGGGSVTLYNLTSSSGTQTISSTTLIKNTLTVNGTINGSSNLTVNADLTGTGTMSMSGGTVEQRVAGAQNFGTTSGSNAWTFSTLIFSNSTGVSKTVTTQTGASGGITVTTQLQIGQGADTAVTVFDAGNRTFTLSGTGGTPFTVPNGTFTASTSTISYTGNNGAGNTTVRDVTYNNLTVNNGSETYTLASSPLNVSGNLTVTAGTLDLQTNSANIGSTGVSNSGGISVSGTLTQSASGTTTVKTSASGAATVGGSGTLTFYNLTIAPTAASGTITLGSAASQTITVNNNFSVGDGTNTVTVTASANNPVIDINAAVTINANGTLVAPSSSAFTIATNFTNNGTFSDNSGTVTLDTTSTATLAGTGSPAITFNNLTVATPNKTVLFTSTQTFRTNGLITITGTSGNPVTIDATTNGNQWFINHQGTENITYAAIQDSGCDGSSTTISLPTSNVNNGNNGSCWSVSTDISGVVYSDEGSTPYDCSGNNLTINLSVNGGANYTTTCTLNTGVFSFPTIPQPASGTPLAFFIDTTETPKGTTITMAPTPSSSLTGIKIYVDHVVLSHENAGPITNSTLSSADNADAGIRYTMSGSNITVDSGMELYVLNSKTYSPGGTVTTQGTGANFQLASNAAATLDTASNSIATDIIVDTGATLTINATTAVAGGDITTSGTGVVTTSSGTPTVTVTGTGNIGGGGTVTVYNLAVNGTQTLQSAVITTNDLSVGTGGTLALNNKNLTVSGGDLTTTGTGVITCTSCSAGTVTVAGTGTIGGGGAVTAYNLTSSSGTQTLSSTTTVLNDLTTNGTINGSANLTVNGDVVGTGTITMSGGTVEQRVAAAQNFGTTSGSNAWTFATLIFSNSTGSSKTISTQTGGSGGVTASTLFQIGKSGDSAVTVFDAGNRTFTLSGTSGTPFAVQSSSTLTGNTSTFAYTGNNSGGNTTVKNVSYTHLTLNNGSETFVPESSPMTINGNLNVTAGTFTVGTASLGVGSTGVTNSGGINVAGTLTQSASGTTTVKTSTSGSASVGGTGTLSFYNLALAPTTTGATITLGTAGSQTLLVSNNLTIGDGTNTVTVTANSHNPAVDINGSFTINANGTFIAPPSATFSIATNFTNNGTFTHNSGIVTLDSTNTAVIAGSGTPAVTFNSLSSTTNGKTIQFTAAETFRINGLFLLSNVSINSTTSSQWFVNFQGTRNIADTTITNSGCDGTSQDIAVSGTNINGGNNGACWLFTLITPTRVKGTIRVGGNTRIK